MTVGISEPYSDFWVVHPCLKLQSSQDRERESGEEMKSGLFFSQFSTKNVESRIISLTCLLFKRLVIPITTMMVGCTI